MSAQSFTPAAGNPKYTKYYDTVIALLTREERWRSAAIRQLGLKPDDVVVDIGCGTASLAIRIKRHQPGARVIGVDPDPEVLAIARDKVRKAVGAEAIEFVPGMGDQAAELVGRGTADKVVSSLVLHQCPVPMKKAIIANMFALLRPGGELVIADFGLQRSAAMRLGFRFVQWADGKEDTQPNADGILPELIEQTGFANVTEASVIQTVSGSISIYPATRPATATEEKG